MVICCWVCCNFYYVVCDIFLFIKVNIVVFKLFFIFSWVDCVVDVVGCDVSYVDVLFLGVVMCSVYEVL